MVQAALLGRHFATEGVRFSNAFSSNLCRARKTAEAVCRAQPVSDPGDGLSVVALPELREQDFGPFEGMPFASRRQNSGKAFGEGSENPSEVARDEDGVETKASMMRRADIFLDNHLLPLLTDKDDTAESGAVIVVAHGMILSNLWRCLLRRFEPMTVSVGPNALPADRPVRLEHLGAWSNTGYLDLDIAPRVPAPATQNIHLRTDIVKATDVDDQSTSAPVLDNAVVASAQAPKSMLSGWKITINAVNGQPHLRGLKRTRGGVGSSSHDTGQQKIEAFFKKPKAG